MFVTSGSRRTSSSATLSAQTPSPSSATLSPTPSSSHTYPEFIQNSRGGDLTMSQSDPDVIEDFSHSVINHHTPIVHQMAYLAHNNALDPLTFQTANLAAETINPHIFPHLLSQPTQSFDSNQNSSGSEASPWFSFPNPSPIPYNDVSTIQDSQFPNSALSNQLSAPSDNANFLGIPEIWIEEESVQETMISQPHNDSIWVPTQYTNEHHVTLDADTTTRHQPTTRVLVKHLSREKASRQKALKSRCSKGVKKDRPWLESSSVFTLDMRITSDKQITKHKRLGRTDEDKAMRKRGACFRCRMWRKKCDLGSPCRNCRNDPNRCADPTMVITQPCFRLDLADCGFFRTKSALWEKPLRTQMNWITRQPVVLSVRYAAIAVTSPCIMLKCAHFEPEKSDIVERKWGNHPHQVRKIPTYCAPDVTEIFSKLEDLIQGYAHYYYQQMNRNSWEVPGIEPSTIPSIVVSTFKIALKYQERSPIVKAALRIWVGSRLCAAKRTLLPEQSLGMAVIDVIDAPDYGHIPIPPMLDYQLDTMMIQWMEASMKRMLKQLWGMLLKRRKEDWFEVYLSIFMLIHNLEIVYESQKEYIKLHKDAPYGRKIAAFSEPMMEQWRWSAQHLLFVYHYHMRRAAFGDAPLFEDSFLSDAISFASLDLEDQEYLRAANQWITGEAECGMSAYADVHQMTWCRNLMQTPKPS